MAAATAGGRGAGLGASHRPGSARRASKWAGVGVLVSDAALEEEVGGPAHVGAGTPAPAGSKPFVGTNCPPGRLQPPEEPRPIAACRQLGAAGTAPRWTPPAPPVTENSVSAQPSLLSSWLRKGVAASWLGCTMSASIACGTWRVGWGEGRGQGGAHRGSRARPATRVRCMWQASRECALLSACGVCV